MRQDFYNDIARDIARNKRSIICVAPDSPNDSPFCYTIGNQQLDLPELLMFVSPKAGGILNVLSERMIERGRAFDDGELVDCGGKFPVRIINADERAKNEFTIQAGEVFGQDYEVQQVLAPDRSGRFPGEPGCDAPYKDVPVLQARTENPGEAREAVERDARGIVRGMRGLPIPTQFIGADESEWPAGDGDRMMAPFTMGTRDALTKGEARFAAKFWRKFTARYPKAIFMLTILGYDADPRELHEFPEVCRYVRWWARFAGMDDPVVADRWVGTGEGRLDPPLSPEDYPGPTAGVGFLAGCGVFGEAMRQEALRNVRPTRSN